MSENIRHCFQKTKMTSSNVLFCPQATKDIQFTVVVVERNQKIFTFKKLESEKFSKWLAINFR